jgi:hypothetical protein
LFPNGLFCCKRPYFCRGNKNKLLIRNPNMKNKTCSKFLLVCAALAALLLAWFSAIQPSATYAAPSGEPGAAYVAVQFGPGHQEVRPISFTAPISGLLALQKTGYAVETKDMGWGIAICSIDGVGCPASDCFCGGSKFWSYETWDGAKWQGYSVGATDSVVGDGAFEGWRWAEWGVGSLPPAPQMAAASKALGWLAQQQSATNGGYGSTGANVESLLAIAANGYPAADWRRSASAPTLLSAMLTGGAFTRNGASNAGKFAVAAPGAGACLPYNASLPQAFYQPAAGWFAPDAALNAWGILGASALSQTVPVSATVYLKSIQQSDGGWEWSPGGFGNGTDTNTTALAVQALIAAGEPVTSTAIVAALDYLHAAQNNDGGFPYDPDSPYGTASDANSSAYVAQALAAAGQDPNSWAPAGQSVIAYLLGLQQPDGSLEWQAGLGANLLATQQAVPALLGRPYPLAARQVTTCPTVFLPMVNKAGAAH